jgi:hypothetical protein
MDSQDPNSQTGLIRLPDDDVENGSQEEMSLREKTGIFLKSKKFHRSMLALIILDCIIVVVEICYVLLNTSCKGGHPDYEENQPLWLQVGPPVLFLNFCTRTNTTLRYAPSCSSTKLD